MNKNPFSLHDFLGYVFPGAFVIAIVCYEFKGSDKIGLYQMIKNIGEMETHNLFEIALVVLLFSYIIGHFIAYLSSLTIEKFSVWMYGYPSSFLLKQTEHGKYWDFAPFNRKDLNKTSFGKQLYKYRVRVFWRILYIVFLFPISSCTLFLGRWFQVRKFVIKTLDDNLVGAIEKKVDELMAYLQIDIKSSKSDFHRIIYHYEFERNPAHARKIDNYVALYGFLRSITLVLNIYIIYIFWYKVLPTISIHESFDSSLFFYVLAFWLIEYIFFMGFMKFYRRMTLESFMCLVTDTSFLKEKSD